MFTTLRNLIRARLKYLVWNQDGATMVEYGLMVALIALVSIAVVTSMGHAVWKVFDGTNTSLAAVKTTTPAASNPVAAPS